MNKKTKAELWKQELDALLPGPVYAARQDSDGIEYQEDVRPAIIKLVGRLLSAALCENCECIAPQCGGGSGPDCETYIEIERLFK